MYAQAHLLICAYVCMYMNMNVYVCICMFVCLNVVYVSVFCLCALMIVLFRLRDLMLIHLLVCVAPVANGFLVCKYGCLLRFASICFHFCARTGTLTATLCRDLKSSGDVFKEEPYVIVIWSGASFVDTLFSGGDATARAMVQLIDSYR